MANKRYTLIFIVAIITIGLTACGIESASKPESPVKKFETAYNKLDVNGMIDCFDPTQAEGMKSVLNLLGSFIKLNAEDVLNIIPILPSLSDSQEEMPKISIDVESTKMISDDTAEVKVKVNYSEKSGEDESYNGLFTTIKIDGKWYIQDIQ